MKVVVVIVALFLAACGNDGSSNNMNNANNANNANNENNANNSNNLNNFNTNNMMDPNNIIGNTNQNVADYLVELSPLVCAYDQTCDTPDFPSVVDCEAELTALADELSVCSQLDETQSAMCLTELDALMCVNDYENYPTACDEAIVYEPCAEECAEDEVFVSDRGDEIGGCFIPCENGACIGLGETCIEGGCAFIECEEDLDCPAPQTCDLNEFVCVE